jgi:threonine/homoserine/homoserine lactone efflux protein
MQWLIGLVGFSLVSAGTPGPNNVLLWASGATFGFRRTMPHIVGTALGIGAMTLAVAAGVGLIVTSLPALTLLMKVAGSAYLLVLAYRIARAGSTEGTTVSRPMNLLEATTFQAVNPKGWIFAFGAVTTFRPDQFSAIAGSLAVAVTMMAVILPCAAAWAVAGGAMSRLLSGGGAGRGVSLVLGGLIAVSVLAVWI